MPRNRGVSFQQWGTCDRCGREYPNGQLNYQNGVLVCAARCTDNLLIQRHDRTVGEILGADNMEEGVDLRFVDKAISGQENEDW